jgi:ribonuclease BN (tRNA processing enzyme)
MTLTSGGFCLVIDAGTGLAVLEREYPKDFTYNLLLSHLHYDHIVGLSTFAPVWKKDSDMKIFTCSRDERPLKEQVLGMFKPPYWPADLAKVSGAACLPIESNVPFGIGPFTITPFAACHPNKTLSFHVTDGKKTVVHLLDSDVNDMDAALRKELVMFCTGADLVVFDAAFSAEDYPSFVGWGHSTAQQGVRLAGECKPKRMMFAHYGQRYNDAELDSWISHFEGDTEFIMARDGMELSI